MPTEPDPQSDFDLVRPAHASDVRRGHGDPLEIEWKLVVVADDPGAILDELAKRPTAPDFLLGPLRQAVQRDRYFDTANGDLAAARIALRLRTFADQPPLVTLKGDAPTDASGLSRRAEIEMPWADEAPATIATVLAEWGIQLTPASGAASEPRADEQHDDEQHDDEQHDDEQHDDEAAAGELVSALGLVIIQDRTTDRRRRSILFARIDGDRASTAIAMGQLMLDEVQYRAGDRLVLHHEVEIEADGEGEGRQLEPFVAWLREEYPESLLPWPWNKLRTGFDLDRLAREDGLERFLTGDGRRLAPAYYEAVLASGD